MKKYGIATYKKFYKIKIDIDIYAQINTKTIALI